MTARLLRLYPGDRTLLGAALVTLAAGWALALGWAPPDRFQGDLQRLMYVHVPLAWAAFGLFLIAFLASVRVLWRGSVAADHLAHASVEVGLVLLGLALALGALWARPVWGVWWTWDPRLTTTAILMVLFAGYLALRRTFEDPRRRATVSAAVGIVAFAQVPIVHWSVSWWRGLHQTASVARLGQPSLAPEMLLTLLVNVLAMSLLAGWLVMRRMRLERLEARRDNRRLRAQLAAASPLAVTSPRELRG